MTNQLTKESKIKLSNEKYALIERHTVTIVEEFYDGEKLVIVLTLNDLHSIQEELKVFTNSQQ